MENKNTTKVVAISLNFNQNQYTLDCVDSLLKSDYHDFIVCLIDNGSSEKNFIDLQMKLPDDHRLLLLRLEDNIGYVGGVNFGIKEGEKLNADYFLIMNNDTLIDKSAINALVETAQKHKDNAIVSGKVYNYDEKDTLQTIGNAKSTKGPLDFPAHVRTRNERDVGQYDNEMEMGMLDDIFWLIPKLVFKKVGYYSDYFFLYGEQNDYALRAIKKNVKLIYTPNAKLWHKGKITTADGDASSPRIEYWGSFAVMKIAVLHFEGKAAKKILRSWMWKRLLKNIKLVLKRKAQFPIIFAHISAIRHFLFWKKIMYKDNGYNPY